MTSSPDIPKTDLPGRAALITGGRRIGAHVAVDLARRGLDIALAYNRSARQASEAAAEIEKAGRRAVTLQADLADPSACQRLVDDAAAALGRLDVLVNMASVYSAVPLGDIDAEHWHTVVDVDLRASYLCSRAAIPYLRGGGRGRIINFSDWVAASGRPRYLGYLPYYVAKQGVIGLSEALALELAADNILVNTVAPGPILAPDDMPDDESRAVMRATPLGRWGGAGEIALAVAYFVETSFVTGETIRVDGGRHLK